MSFGIVAATIGGVALGSMMSSDNSAPAAVDTTPTADASKYSADKSLELGNAQLAEAKRQYDTNAAIAKPVVDAQLGIMEQTKQQGQDYYNYNIDTFRPVEQGLVRDAESFNTAGAQERFAQTAAADLEGQQANQSAQNNRAMAAMGVNPNSGRFAGLKRSEEITNAAARAGAVTRGRVQADALGTAKRMDVAGLGRGLPGASTGAYQVATGAGTAAVGNQMAPGAQLLSGMNQGNSTIMAGAGQQIQGLSSVMNANAGMYDAQLKNQGDGGAGMIVGLAGAAATAY